MFECFAGHAGGGGVFSGDGCGRLWMEHLDTVYVEAGGVLGVVEQGANFGFGGGGHDIFEDGVDVVDGVILGGGGG